MVRNTFEILADLKKLIYTPGYIYSLCMILFEDFHQDLNEIHKVDYRSKLSVKECSLILGFLIQKQINFSIPPSPEKAFEWKERTYELMEELHWAINAPQLDKIKDMFERQEQGEVFEDNIKHRLDFFVKDGGMVEPMFYAGDGIYDFQYMEYLEKKYKYDKEWLLNNKSCDLEITPQIVSRVKEFFTKKGELVSPINVKDVFPKVAAKTRKSLKKKKLSKKELDEMERKTLISASYYRYVALFPSPLDTQNDSNKGWEEFYHNLLGLFVIKPSDIEGVDQNSISSFFSNFSFVPPGNKDFAGPGFFNVLNSCPFIKLDGERYFLPIGYLLPEAIYESPFYWMWDDKSYRNSLAQHRGDVGEEISYELLSKVFGEGNTHQSVSVESKKGTRETDIDVLCVLGNKALCVQVKSKKLTLAAKRGDFDQLSKDFKGAVQDAYNQGIVSRNSVLSKTPRFFDVQGNELNLPTTIDEVYIMGLTTENYPSLAHQVHIMLEKEPNDPYPLFISVFDLELLVHYLNDPYDFLYYVRQRTDLMEYFKADEELVYLGYHLDQKLWPLDGYDFVSINNDFGGIIDRNYYPYKLGVSHLLPEKDDPISNRRKNPQYDALLTEIKSTNHPNTPDIIFHLLDWSDDARTNIISQLNKLKKASKIEKRIKSFATAPAASFGLSFVILDHFNPKELEARTGLYAKLRKYVSKCDFWIGIGTFADNPNMVDMLIYIDDPWMDNPRLEVEFSDELARMRSSKITPLSEKKKIGRNTPCPCQSGKKYKKCCGMNV